MCPHSCFLVLPEDLINFQKQIPSQEQIPARVYLGRETLATLSPGRPLLPGLGKLGKGCSRPGSVRSDLGTRPPALPGAPRSRPEGSPRSPGTPTDPCPLPRGRRGSPQPRVPRPGSGSSCRVRSGSPRIAGRTLTFPVRRAAGQGRAPRVLLNSPGWERLRFARSGRARDPAPSGRRARVAVGGTGRSAGPPSAGWFPREERPLSGRSRPPSCRVPQGVRPAGVRSLAVTCGCRSPLPHARIPGCSGLLQGNLAGAPPAARDVRAKQGEKPGPAAPSACDLRGRPWILERVRGVAEIWAGLKVPAQPFAS